MRTGGQIVVDHLLAQHVRHVFLVPGESFLGLLDALHGQTRLRVVTTRHESAAAMMAEATGKLTGQPGVAVVTRGPGAANAVAGVYIAAQDQSPMVLLVGLPARARSRAHAFQEIDLARLYGGMAKHVAIAECADTLPRQIALAFRSAVSGRAGPAVLGLPEDVLFETAGAPNAHPDHPAQCELAAPDIESLQAHLNAAQRPLLISGSARWSAEASAALTSFAQSHDLPVAASFRRQDRFDNSHDCYVGHLGFAPHPGLAGALERADLVIALGACLDDVTTRGHTLLNRNGAHQKLVLVAPDAHRPDAIAPYTPDLSIPACPAGAALALARQPAAETIPWRGWRRSLRADYELSLAQDHTRPDTKGQVDLGDVAALLTRRLGADAIICNGAGHYAAILQRHYVYRAHPTQLAPLSGTMGYGLPAAIAAKLAFPERTVIAVAGDGCFQMTGAELATCVQLELPIVILIANNHALGSIRNAQMQAGQPRIIATTLVNPDFAALAQACGAAGYRADSLGDFSDALEAALASTRPAVIEISVA